jgi:hypothetical protein
MLNSASPSGVTRGRLWFNKRGAPRASGGQAVYLKALNTDEKQAFLELAYIAARADRILALEELELWQAFREEVELPSEQYTVQEQSLKVAAARFTTDRSRRIALIELTGMVMADGIQAEQEQDFLLGVAAEFGLDESFVARCMAWVTRHATIVSEGRALVDGDAVRQTSPA